MKLKNFFQNRGKEIVFVTVIVLCVVLIVSTMALLNGYSDGLEEQARTQVALYATDTQGLLSEQMSMFAHRAEFIARNVAVLTTESAAATYLQDVQEDPYFGNIEMIRFFKFHPDGTYDEYENGFPFEGTESEAVLSLLAKNELACTGVAYDHDTADKSVVGFYAPVEGSDLMDCIVVFYPLSEITVFAEKADKDMLSYSEFVVFCSQKGRIKEILHESKDTFANRVLSLFNKEDSLSKHQSIMEVLGSEINDPVVEKQLQDLIDKGESDVVTIRISGVNYVVSVSGAGPYGGGMYVIGLYLSSAAYESGYRFANSILATLIICFIILIGVLAYVMISRHRINKRIFEIGTIDSHTGAPTMLRFERDAKDILEAHKATNFAVILAEVRFFNYIAENFGEDAANAVLQYMKLIYSKSLQTDECYAYLENGQFVLLYHYREQQDLISRLKGINAVAYKYPGLRAQKYSIKLQFGVYEIDRASSQPIQSMVDKAIVAKDMTVEFGTSGLIKFYTEKLRENYLANADVEVRMEAALRNDEFKVFFQPKYNIAQNRQDGCEALVRWYEPEQNYYRRPDTFLPLFEANGFIVEVDKYVYLKVCEYIRESIERGESVYPVSVNVSRITAIQPDFIEYYTRIKRQYKIMDNFLMLEFTESFAYENYDALKEIIDKLHANGFRCSIDDFGSGYSSYNILKELPMDEIKLDRFFIYKGLSEERDNVIIESVIRVAKELKMKITQEGVETVEDVRRLRRLGCEVIQGYYYAKPLPMVDYIAFVNEKNVMDERKLMDG